MELAILITHAMILVFILALLVAARKEALDLAANTEEMAAALDAGMLVAAHPNSVKLLEELSAQFKTDSGMSMRDAINRVDEATRAQLQAAEDLKTDARRIKIEFDLGQERLQGLLVELHRLAIKIENVGATGARIEEQAKGVARKLVSAQERADEVVGEPGAAADAAVQSAAKTRN